MSQASTIIAIIWAILCSISLIIWLWTGNTDNYFYIYYSTFLGFITALATTLFCFRNLTNFSPTDPIGKAWWFLSRGLLFWTVGSFSYFFYPLIHGGEQTPFPWYSDIGYLMFMPFALFTLMTLRMNTNVAAPFKAWIAAFVVAMAISGVALVMNAENLKEIGIAAFMATMAYVVINPMLLAMIIVTASVLRGQPICRPWWFALAGLFLFAIGDLLHVLLHNLGNAGNITVLLDLTWPVSSGLIAIAATTTCSIYRKT
jgi:hypothetical protein